MKTEQWIMSIIRSYEQNQELIVLMEDNIANDYQADISQKVIDGLTESNRGLRKDLEKEGVFLV